MRLEGQFKGDFSSLKTFRRPSLAMETGEKIQNMRRKERWRVIILANIVECLSDIKKKMGF